MIRSIALAALGAVLFGCSGAPSEGGGGFEGEALTGVVRFAGSRVAGAEVSFLEERSARCLAKGVTNSVGSFRLEVPRGTAGFLEVRSSDTALFREFLAAIPDTSIDVEAVRPGIWTAKVVLAGVVQAGARLAILGSTSTVASSSDGSVSLLRTGIHPEWARLVLSDGSARDILLPPLRDSVIEVPDHPVVVLDDFEGPAAKSALGYALGSGWWFANDDSGAGGGSAVLPAGTTKDFGLAYSTQEAFAGTSLSTRFSIDLSHSAHFAQVGVVLADTEYGRWMDLSKVDSFTFRIRGSGSIRLLFATRTGLEPSFDPAGLFGVDLQPTSTWTRVRILPSDIVAPSGSRPAQQGIPWSVDSKHCRNIVFAATSSATLQLDDVEFHGVLLDDLIAR